MAKTAIDPTPAPKPAPPAPLAPPPALDSDPPPVPPPPSTEPEIATSRHPDGVVMHDAGKLPYTTDRAERNAVTPESAPPGWKGVVTSCGGCGKFLRGVDRCPTCAPSHLPPHIVNGGPRC